MKWGVRKQTLKVPLTSKQITAKKTFRKKIAGQVVTSVLVAAWVSTLLNDSGTQAHSNYNSYKQTTNKTSSKAKSAADFINERRDVEVNSLKRMHKEGKMDATQAEHFLKILNDRYDRKVAAA